jgi:hypothetical protein
LDWLFWRSADADIVAGRELRNPHIDEEIPMKVRSLVALLLLSIPTLACGAPDDEKTGPTSCQQICATAKMLKCANEDTPGCIRDCDLIYQSSLSLNPDCKPELDAAAACLASRGSSDFECTASGRGAPKSQVCAVEQDKADTCILG